MIDAAFAATNETKGVILDLRGNFGGLEVVVELCRRTLGAG